VACVGGGRHVSGGDGGGHRRRRRRRSEWIGGVFMAVLRLPVVGLTALLSMVVLGALVVAFEAFRVATFRGAHGDVRKQHGDEACLDVHGGFVT